MPELRGAGLVALRVGVAMLLVAGVGAIAHLPLGEPPANAVLRVALRTPLAQVEVCRDRTQAELDTLPVHMRQPRHCEVTTVDYRLSVEVDGTRRIHRRLVHRGVRRNRPLVADETLSVGPGARRVAVRFVPAGELDLPAGASLPEAAYDSAVDFPAGRIRLLVLDDDGSRFRLLE